MITDWATANRSPIACCVHPCPAHTSELDAFDVVIRRTAAGTASRGMVLTGLRGVGKTVLLNEMKSRASDAGWFVVSIEGRADTAGATTIRSTLARSIAVQARQLGGPGISDRVKRALQSINSFNLRFGTGGIDFGIEASPGLSLIHI